MKELIRQLVSLILVLSVLFGVYSFVPLKYIEIGEGKLGDTSITTIQGSDTLSSSRTTINNNFSSLNTNKVEISALASTSTLPSLTTLTGLTTVGTIGTGVWQGTPVDELFGGTGFSTYTKGDLLYSSATNVLSKLALGTTDQILTVDATGVPAWADGGVNETLDYNWTGHHIFSSLFATNASSTNATSTNAHFTNTPTVGASFTDLALTASTTTYTASGTYNKSTGVTRICIEAWGAGGGGGGTVSSGSWGGAGGGGEYKNHCFLPSEVGASETVTIGDGGVGGIGESTAPTSGGNTTFGSLLTAYAGGFGANHGSSNGGNGAGGAGLSKGGNGQTDGTDGTAGTPDGAPNGRFTGGVGNGGDSVYGGGGGDQPNANNCLFQAGGTSMLGGNGADGAAGSSRDGADGTVPGGGGGASCNAIGDTTSRTGGDGARGELRITEYF